MRTIKRLMSKYSVKFCLNPLPVLILLFFFCFQILIPNFSHAVSGQRIGTNGAQFLRLPVNARAIAMGEAYSAETNGPDSLYWNPAGLGRIESKSLSLMHAVYLESIFYDYASYAQKIRNVGTFGLGVQYLSAGSIEEIDEKETSLGSFNTYDMAISLGWAKEFGRFLGMKESEFIVGLTGKFIQSKLTETGITGAADIGILWDPIKKNWISLGVQNLGPSLKFFDAKNELPLNMSLGYVNHYFESLTLSLDVNSPRNNNVNVAFGTEYKRAIASDMWLAGRSGFNSRTLADIKKLSSLSAGVGFGWKAYALDFAWVPFGDLGNTYRFSLSAKF